MNYVENDKNLLSFKLDGDWLLCDFEKFLGSISNLHNIIYKIDITIINILAKYYSFKYLKNEVAAAYEMKSNKDWLTPELYYKNREVLLEKVSDFISEFQLPDEKENIFDKFLEEESEEDILEYLDWCEKNEMIINPPNKMLLNYITDKNSEILRDYQLRIRRMHMSSPGDIQVDGGSLVKEVRELIKDFSYRNKQEKEKGECEIELLRLQVLQRKISILKSLGFTNDQIQQIFASVNVEAKSIDYFINKGKVGLIIDGTK